MPDSVEIRTVGYDHPDAQVLIDEVQAEYVVRYGGPDETPIDPAEFARPNGLFAVLYAPAGPDDVLEPMAMGGWRRTAEIDPSGVDSVGEIKRMYVRAAARGSGYARALLAHLEQTAREAGLDRFVLETGQAQPEAIALYRSCGYTAVAPFGHYAEAALSIHLGKALTRG